MTDVQSFLQLAGGQIALWSRDAAILTVAAFVIVRFDRLHRPAFRARVWTSALVCMLLVPVLPRVLPFIPATHRVREAFPEEWIPAFAAPVSQFSSKLDEAQRSSSRAWPTSFLLWEVAGGLWLAGVVFAASRTIHGVLIFSWGTRQSRTVSLNEIAPTHDWNRLESPPPRIRLSAAATSPLVYGWFRPSIFLPDDIELWSSADERAVILRHEIAHLRRRDHWVVWIEGIVRSLLFFHPFVRFTCRHLALEREISCDDEVIRLGVDGNTYANTILKVAERSIRRSVPAFGMSFAASEVLDRRIQMIFQPRSGQRSAALESVFICSMTVVLIALGISQIPRSSAFVFQIPGRFSDSFHATLPMRALALLLQPPNVTVVTVAEPELNLKELVRLGHLMTQLQATDLELRLQRNPDDAASRLLLLGYYDWSIREFAAQRAGHLRWLILHRPGLRDLWTQRFWSQRYSNGPSEGAEEWLSQVQARPGDLEVLYNAASFLGESDRVSPLDLAIRGEAAEPEDPRWAKRIGTIHLMRAIQPQADDETRQRESTSAVEAMKRELRHTNDLTERAIAENAIADAALNAGLFDEAEGYALQVIQTRDALPALVHVSSNVLGVVALQRGDVAQAQARLLASVAFESPFTSMPRMRLARELLAHGETATVTEYLRRCAVVWPSTASQLLNWTAEINSGAVPAALARYR